VNDRDDVDASAAAVHRRDAAQVIRWIFVLAIVAALVAVAMDNRDEVRVGTCSARPTLRSGSFSSLRPSPAWRSDRCSSSLALRHAPA
jgi:hypothetical protein